MIEMRTTDGLQIKITDTTIEILASANKGDPEESAQLDRIDEIAADLSRMGWLERLHTRNQANGPDRVDFIVVPKG